MTSRTAYAPLRLAVIGCGWAGRRQVEAAAELEGDVEIAWLVDSDPDHLRSTAEALGIRRTAIDLDAALSDPTVDAVSICTPHPLHAPMAVRAAAAGKHILVEKPMAITVDEGTHMLAAAAVAGVRLVVAENQVYEPATVALARLVSSGDAFGNLAFGAIIDGYRSPAPAYPGRRSWLTQPEQGGTGTWLLQGIHTIARARRIFGEVASIYVREHRTPTFLRPDLEATMSAMLGLESGASVWLVQTPEVALASKTTVELYGDTGVVVADATGYETVRPDSRTRVAFQAGALSSYAMELQAFAAEVRTSHPAPTTGASELRSLAVAEAGLRSARTGQVIVLADAYPGLWTGPFVAANSTI